MGGAHAREEGRRQDLTPDRGPVRWPPRAAGGNTQDLTRPLCACAALDELLSVVCPVDANLTKRYAVGQCQLLEGLPHRNSKAGTRQDQVQAAWREGEAAVEFQRHPCFAVGLQRSFQAAGIDAPFNPFARPFNRQLVLTPCPPAPRGSAKPTCSGHGICFATLRCSIHRQKSKTINTSSGKSGMGSAPVLSRSLSRSQPPYQ